MNDLIRLTQLPVIEERLKALKADIEQDVADAQSLACTADTVQTVKKKRAELNSKFNELEEQRKRVKKAYMEPWDNFEAVYKDCVSVPFRSADASLKGKIGDVEQVIKDEAEQEMREYFTELCAAEGVEWLKYERINLVIGMTEAKQKTHKKLREYIGNFVKGVSADVKTISGMDNAPEIMMEYRECLNLSEAISIVNDRIKRLAAEKEAQEQRTAYQEAAQAHIAEVEAVLPPPVVMPLQPPQEAEKVYTCKFTVHATKTQLKALKAYLNENGLKYE